MHYIVYLDEFAHLGPFNARSDRRYNENPAFGLGGLILPYTRVRSFATWFFQFKNALLSSELENTGRPAWGWEKKGAELFHNKTISRYPSIRLAGNRLISGILSHGGRVIFVGYEKLTQDPEHFDSEALYGAVLRNLIRRLETHFKKLPNHPLFSITLDETDDGSRKAIVKAASLTMFGKDPCHRLLEPPAQVESRLYQTIQAADWLCGILGRYAAYHLRPSEFTDFEWAERLYGQRLRAASIKSSILTIDQQRQRRETAAQYSHLTVVQTTITKLTEVWTEH